MENRTKKFFDHPASFFIIVFIIILLFHFYFEYRKKDCVWKKHFAIISNIDKTILGAVFLTYYFEVNGVVYKSEVKRYESNVVVKNLKVRDTIIVIYCAENPEIGTAFMLDGITEL